MKKTNLIILGSIIGISLSLLVGFNHIAAPEPKVIWKQITTVESVVPGGAGRSRMITTNSEGKLEEIKMKNFFSITGINFGNVRENDQLITDRFADLTNQGWELHDITSGVYSAERSTGIFITRYLFKKEE